MRIKYTYKKVISTGPRPHIIYQDGKAHANYPSKMEATAALKKLKRIVK